MVSQSIMNFTDVPPSRNVRKSTRLMAALLSSVVAAISIGCREEAGVTQRAVPSSVDRMALSAAGPVLLADEFSSATTVEEIPFHIHWPPIDPASPRYETWVPLLKGVLEVIVGTVDDTTNKSDCVTLDSSAA